MKRFSQLYEALDSTTSTLRKVAALRDYFRTAPPEDAAWTLSLLMGRRFKRLLPSGLLVGWTLQERGIPEWLFGECYAVVGDLAETIALLLDSPGPAGAEEVSLSEWTQRRILPLRQRSPEEQREQVVGWWRSLPRRELYLLNKLLTGEMRVGVSQKLVIRGLAEGLEVPVISLTHRLMGDWEPSVAFFESLKSGTAGGRNDPARPYPFFLASPLDEPVESLGPVSDWSVEWKWDGIRGELIRRAGQTFLWSRGEELVTPRFPEITGAAERLSGGTVLDGEILAFAGGKPLPFAQLQRRIGRQKLTAEVLAEAPVAFVAFDLLEDRGVDIRELPLEERRARLEKIVAQVGSPLQLSERLRAQSWGELAELRTHSRERGVEGLMLKRRGSPYRTGRRRGDWWKWKIDPYSVDAVLIYAQPGSGKRANLLTDYTFGVWHEGELVPVAKAYSGLSDEEILQMDRWIRSHTVQRFGPVRAVEPVQVFELHFEGIAPSPRHRSGVAVRFPRIARWRTDKPAAEADTLAALRALIPADRNSDGTR